MISHNGQGGVNIEICSKDITGTLPNAMELPLDYKKLQMKKTSTDKISFTKIPAFDS